MSPHAATCRWSSSADLESGVETHLRANTGLLFIEWHGRARLWISRETVEDMGLPLAVTNMRGWETMGKGQSDGGDW